MTSSILNRRRLNRFPLLRFVVLIILALIRAVPVLWMIATSLKPEAQTITVPPRWLPEHLSDLTFDNYRSVLFFGRGVDLLKSFGHNIYVALIGNLVGVIVGVLAGYGFARVRFPGRNLLFALTVASLIVPGGILLIPNYVTVWRLGWVHTYKALLFFALAGGFRGFSMCPVMLCIPRGLEEGAHI